MVRHALVDDYSDPGVVSEENKPVNSDFFVALRNSGVRNSLKDECRVTYRNAEFLY